MTLRRFNCAPSAKPTSVLKSLKDFQISSSISCATLQMSHFSMLDSSHHVFLSNRFGRFNFSRSAIVPTSFISRRNSRSDARDQLFPEKFRKEFVENPEIKKVTAHNLHAVNCAGFTAENQTWIAVEKIHG